MIKIIFAFMLLALLSIPVMAQDTVASWVVIQPDDAAVPGTVVYHKTFHLDFEPDDAYVKYTCYTPMDFGGTHYRIFINRVLGPGGSFWSDAQYASIAKALRKGDNDIDIEVTWVPNGTSGPILAKLEAKGKDKDGKDASAVVRSDETWGYYAGKYDLTNPAAVHTYKKVIVAGAADKWESAKSPMVLPKIDTSSLVGVTNVKLKGGNAGSLYQFNLVRDYSDKFYFTDALGYSSIEDYIFGQSNYQYPGVWFWGYDKQLAHNQEIEGYDYTVYPWVWVPAEWYRKQKNPPMVKCLEHNGQDGFGLSLWSPELIKLNEEMYGELKSNFGEKIRFVYPGIYGDFGEAHYMAGWNNWMNPKPDHQHPDFWAGDDLAKADFRQKMLAKYINLDALNAAWQTSFKSNDEIIYPKLDSSAPRRYTLDFINWYYDCMTDFTAKVCSIAKKKFPNVPIAPKLGCGDENPMWGQDNSAIPEALAKIGVGVRSTHGSSGNFAVRRLSSACKFYGNKFETETAGGTNRNDAIRKFFIDESSGCSELFEYPDAMLKVADIFSGCRKYLRGEHSITEVALFFPTSWHRCNLRQGYPPKLTEAADDMRDVADFDIVDENMILDGALDKCRVLAMFDGNFTEQAVYDKIADWVNKGGTLILRSEQLPFMNVEGKELPVSELKEEAQSDEGAVKAQGDGQIIVWGGDWSAKHEYLNLIYASVCPSVADGACGGPNGTSDGVWISMFENYALYLNNNSVPAHVSENISEDYAKSNGLAYSPKYLKYEVDIPAKSQVAHFFDRPSFETTIECESMTGAQKLQIDVIHKSGCGTPGKAVKIQGKGQLDGSFNLTDEADYSFCSVVDPEESGAILIVDGKKVADLNGPAGYHQYMYPLNVKVHLKPGKHTLAVRFSTGACTADKVIITTDTGLAGFAYGFTDPKVDQSW